jgi:23S rRNA (adenine2503-C2)-methyltransferase
MIHGENDTPAHAKKLANLLSGMLCHVNLIPLNAVKERSYVKSSREAIEEFVKILEKSHITATVRRRLGSDINASCGQLRRATKEENNADTQN